MAKALKEKVLSLKMLSHSVFRMSIESEYISSTALPGQFVNIKCGDGINNILRRPISICGVDRQKGTFDIAFQVRGKGTRLLSEYSGEDLIDLTGPLGNSFSLPHSLIPQKHSKVAAVGGGIGIFPLLFLLKEMNNAEKHAYLGFRDCRSMVMVEDFREVTDKLLISTDDGSAGYKGAVTDLFEQHIKTWDKPDIIYACGPVPMLRKIVSIAQAHDIMCQVSMEQRMGCGIGACLVCVCATRQDDGWKYSRVCKDGPVFWGQDVIFEE